MKTVRCAIYTRKSSEEGLQQDFNSLDAQREACAAYILSQASEGWVALPGIYDDGGLSGGTLERPALQRLLREIAAGRIDTVVVYKVDRLTRSLSDFSKLVDVFDAAGTSFVSVTQSFNTTTSMGRLTLNMLLSFAQFEREVTAERIRDKIAASKAKGMWMGGTPPLGYAPDGRSLKIVEEHATIVRDIFARYLQLGNVRRVAEALARDGLSAPRRTRVSGTMFGGVPFSRGQIYTILKCATYVGEVHHGGQVYAGLHKPILERDVWDRAQAMLAENLQGHRSGARATRPSLLAGKVFDEGGAPLVATHACKGRVRYRYYVSRALHHRVADTGMRIPALELERAVAASICAVVGDPLQLAEKVGVRLHTDDLLAIIERCEALTVQINKRGPAFAAVIERLTVGNVGISITLSSALLSELIGGPVEHALTVDFAARLTRSGRVLRLVDDRAVAVAADPDQSLIRLIAQGRRYWAILRTEPVDIKRLAQREGVAPSWITRVLRLAFLSPKVIEAALGGRLRAGADAKALIAAGAIEAGWGTQHQRMLRS